MTARLPGHTASNLSPVSAPALLQVDNLSLEYRTAQRVVRATHQVSFEVDKADRFVLNTNTVPRRWYFEGQLESNTLRSGEQFEFQD